MRTLLKKDLKNAYYSFGPALLLGVPLILLIYFAKSDDLSWISAFWITFFFSTTSLYYRSFGQENQSRNFLLYVTLRVPRLSIYFSQTIIHILSATLLGYLYFGLSLLFFSPPEFSTYPLCVLIPLVAMALSPLGTLLGLSLQLEREFLFALLYLPLATPVFLAGLHLSQNPDFDLFSAWTRVLIAFILLGSFMTAFLFKFFFDELSQTS